MENKTIEHKLRSPLVNMGLIKLRQPIPTKGIDQVDPFLLLHHFGPYTINERSNPFDVGPHPHRGFEPITLLFSGEQLHRDSLGNEMLVKAGDVQWITAGRGIIHAEGPSKEFVKRGGELEGIQLWLNLPAKDKMIPAAYQHVKSEDIPVVENDEATIQLKVVAGEQGGKKGLIKTRIPVNVFTARTQPEGEMQISIPRTHTSLLYLLDGEVLVNDAASLKKGATQMVTFHQDGEAIHVKAIMESTFIVLSGEPIEEKVASWGPYVMNTQTEIIEALRDYQQGKMGYLY